MVSSVSIRLGTTGKADVQADFAAIADSGDASAKRLAASYQRAGQDIEAATKRQADAASKIAAIMPSSTQATVNASVGTGYDGSRNANAAQFTALLAQQEQQVERVKAAIDPLYTAQKRYDAEIAAAGGLLKTGAISEAEHAAAVAVSGRALQEAKNAVEGHTSALGLNRAQVITSQSALLRFTDAVISGRNPLTAFALEAHKGVEVLSMDDGGMAGGLAKVAAFVTPVTVGIAAITAVVAIGAIAWVHYADEMAKLDTIAAGAGAAIGATGAQLEANAQAVSRNGVLTVGAARDIEVGYVKMGGIGTGVLQGLTSLTADFAAATGTDAKAAQETLGKAFQDPIKGAEELAGRYGFLTQAQIESIKKTADQNGLYAAQVQMLTALAPAFDKAAEHAAGFARIFDEIKASVSGAWEKLNQFIAGANAATPLAQKLAELQEKRAQAGATPFGGFMVKELDTQIAATQKAIADQQKATTDAASKFAETGREAGSGYTGYDQKRSLEEQRDKIADGLRNGKYAPDELQGQREALEAYTRAINTYLGPAEKKRQLDLADVAVAQARAKRDPAALAAASANRERIEQAGQVATNADVQADAMAKHAFALGQTTTPPPTPALSGPPLIPTPSPDDWSITATQVGEGGSLYPGLVITGASASSSIDAIVFEYRFYTGTQAAGDDWVAAGSEQPSTTSKPILILHDGAVCQAAVSYRKGVGTGTRLILGPETIGTTTIDFANIDGTTKTALLNEVSDAGTAAAAASAQIAIIGSDGYLSRGEKPAVIQDWTAIGNEAPALDAQADALGVDRTTFDGARGALGTYLSSLTPAWNDTTQDTAIVAATFRGKFDDYYFAKISLTTAIDAAASKVATWDGVYGTGKDQLIAEAAQAASNAAAALTQLNAIASDGILSRGEKPAVILDWNAANNEVGALQAQAAQLGVSASVYTAAKAALDAYLGSLSPAWNDDTQDTAINGATFQGKFTDYYYARALLVNAMAQAAAQTASPTNLLRITLNERPGTAWSFGTKSSASFTSNPATPGVAALEGVFYGRPYRQVTWTPKAVGDGVSILYRQAGLAPSAATAFRATPGDRLFWGATFLATGCTISAAIRFFDGGFNVVSTQAFGVPSTAAWPNSATGDFSSFRYGGFFTVPAGAVWGEVEMFGSGTSTAAANLVVTAPMVCSVPIAQTAWPAFVPGPNAVDGADPTGLNVALDTANVGGTPTQQVLGELQTAQTDIDNVTTTANATAAFTADVADNNHASPDEKKRYVVQVAQWQNDVTAEVAKGLSLGINAESAAYASAWNTFYNYLINTVQINNVSVSTYFDRSQFLSLSQAFTNAAQTLKNALKDQATKLTQDTTANVFLDPRFERPTDQTAWTGFDSRAVIQPIADGQRVQIPTGASSDVNLYAFPVVMGPFDRIDVEFEVSVDSGVTSASLFGINFDGRDGAGNGYSQAGVLFLPTSVARGGWVTVKGSIYGSTYGANLASVLPHIVCQPLTGGNIYIRNPRGYRVPGLASNLNVNGRGTSALLNSTSIVAGIKVVNNTGFVLSSTPNGTSNVTVNIGAFTYTTDSGMTISYPAGSIPGLAFSTTYYVWRVDPALNGGTSYGISTSLNDASKPGQLYVGYIITPSATGTGGGGGGGGNPGCVTSDMWVATDQGDVLASDIKPGDKVLCLTEDLAGTEYAEVLSNEPATNWCIEITSASGVTLDLAVNTPMTPRSGAGGAIMAANVWMQDVAIEVDGVLSWEPCTIKALPDMPTVAKINLGGRVFAAGKVKGRYLFSHNINPAKP